MLVLTLKTVKTGKNNLVTLKATVENPRGSVEKLSPKESVEGANTVLRGSVRAPNGFAQGKSRGSLHTAPQNSVGTQGNLLRGQLFLSAPRIFNSCSDYQNHEVYWQMNPVFTFYYSNV